MRRSRLGTCVMGHMGNGSYWQWGHRGQWGVGYSGYGAHGQWSTWAMGVMGYRVKGTVGMGTWAVGNMGKGDTGNNGVQGV